MNATTIFVATDGEFTFVQQTLERLGYMFYVVHPSKVQAEDFASVPNFISDAIPIFFLLMFVEMVVAGARKQQVYSFEDFICSISLGLMQQMLTLFYKSFFIAAYVYLYNHYRLIDFQPSSALTFVLLLLSIDLTYYWFHRCSHEWHLLWIAHSVHHSGEYYNLATALRQGATQPISSGFFYLPLALLGLPPAPFVAHSQLNTLYQFWIHTEQVAALLALSL